SEYLPLLVWERVLGHAGDPARLPHDVSGPGSLWGDFENHECAHTRPDRSAAHKVLRIATEPPAAWRAYLDRQPSNTSHALAACPAECRRHGTVIAGPSAEDRKELAERAATALAYVDSPIVRLRHAAPVGHGFGVPSPAEVLDAWQRTRAHLGRREPAALDD